MPIDSAKAIDFLEIAYDGSRDQDTWQADLLDAAMGIARATSGVWFDFDVRGTGEGSDEHDGMWLHTLRTRLSRGDRFHTPHPTASAWNRLPSGIVKRLFGGSLATTFTSMVGEVPPEQISAWREVWLEPIVDNLGIIARAGDGDAMGGTGGMGEGIVSGIEERLTPSAREVRLLDRVSYHFAAATRLRRRAPTMQLLDDAEAVLTPGGKVLHANDAAQTGKVLLEDGRRRRDEARKKSTDAERALEIWTGLVAGRWSLVDHFDSDGKRFLLAVKNAVDVAPRGHLTPREQRICNLAALGHRDKEIAYMLGLSMPAVGAALHRARRKLAVGSRVELARAFRDGSDGAGAPGRLAVGGE